MGIVASQMCVSSLWPAGLGDVGLGDAGLGDVRLGDVGCSEPTTSAGAAWPSTAKPERCRERAKGELGQRAVPCSEDRDGDSQHCPGPILQSLSKMEEGGAAGGQMAHLQQ